MNRDKSLHDLISRIVNFLGGYDGKLEEYFEANLTSFTYLFFAETLQVFSNTTKLPDLNELVLLFGILIFMFASIYTAKPIRHSKYGFIVQLLTIALYSLIFAATLIFPYRR